MPDTQEKFYLTTPIYYVNARPHIGHAYTTIVADVLARRHRLLGHDTFFLTGTDEHGQKIERSAAAAGIPPQQFADQVSKSFEDLWTRMGITHNAYIRTTDPKHQRGVQKLFSDLYAKGFITLASYTGQYSVGEEMFVEGPPGTIGPDGKPTETVTEENFFFKLSAFQRPLIDLIESGTLAIEPESRRNEVLSFLRGPAILVIDEFLDKNPKAGVTYPRVVPREVIDGAINAAIAAGKLGRSLSKEPYVPGALKDLSISRSSFTWGIPVPEPAASAASQKHVIYVWLDALANYMTAIGYGSEDPSDIAHFEHYWPADLHLVGKEIIRFHCVYWPAFLLAAGIKLPKKVQAHGWLLFEESKMSKSRGNIVRTETILDAFGNLVYASLFPNSTHAEQDLFASDVLRYFLLREIPFGQDGSFSFDALIQRYNSDLANGYGNLVSRTLAMIQKYSDSSIPTPRKRDVGDFPELAQNYFFNFISGPGKMAFDNEVDKKNYRLRYSAGSLENGISNSFDHNDFTRVTENLWWAISSTDSHLSINAPWKMAEGSERDEVLYVAAEAIRIITALLYPILPFVAAKVWKQLGLGDIEAAAKNGELQNLKWGGLKPGTKLGPLAPIFPRAEKGLAQIMTNMEQTATPKPEQPAAPTSEVIPSLAASAEATAATAPPQITIDDFAKLDLRAARILIAERIPKADKLLRLEVDLGTERRQILSGIAEWYTPEELIGRMVVVIANLAPRKMRGLESHGMLLAASEGDGKPILASFGEAIAPGARVK